jgi:hypothetical protein
MSKSLYQGDEDSLCGLYAVVNSLRTLWPDELSDKETSALFQTVAHSLDRWPSILWAGTHDLDMVTMLKAAQRFISDTDLRFTWYRPFKKDSIDHVEVFETNLRHELDCPGTAAIVMTRRPTDHWLVVDRFAQQYMMTVDSGETKPIRLAHCGLRKGRKVAKDHKFVFDYLHTFVVRRDA